MLNKQQEEKLKEEFIEEFTKGSFGDTVILSKVEDWIIKKCNQFSQESYERGVKSVEYMLKMYGYGDILSEIKAEIAQNDIEAKKAIDLLTKGK